VETRTVLLAFHDAAIIAWWDGPQAPLQPPQREPANTEAASPGERGAATAYGQASGCAQLWRRCHAV